MATQDTLAYTNKDRASILARLHNVVLGIEPDWPFDPANFGNILLEAFAHVGDILVFYQDAQARESYLSTARTRRSLLRHLKSYPYTPRRNSPATVDVTFTLGQVPANNVVIPAGTIVSTQDVGGSVDFRLLANLVVPAGLNPPSVVGTVENSESVIDLFNGTDLPNQSYTLTSTPFIDTLPFAENGVVDNLGTYTQVDNFLASGPNDLHYTVFVDENERATLSFGNGVNGAKPDGPLTIKYKIGGGAIGNVPANSVSTIRGTFTDVISNPVVITVNNAASAQNGEDRESNASLRKNGPESLRVIKGVVTKDDFEQVAVTIPGVIRALMLTKEQDEAVAENSGNLHIIASGGEQPTELLKQTVYNTFYGPNATHRTLMTFKLSVLGVLFVEVNFEMTVFFNRVDIVSKNTTAAAIRQALADYFSIVDANGVTNTNVGFGYDYAVENAALIPELPLSTFINVVTDIPGVRKIGDTVGDFQINGERSDLIIGVREFPVLGTVVIRDGDTGLVL